MDFKLSNIIRTNLLLFSQNEMKSNQIFKSLQKSYQNYEYSVKFIETYSNQIKKKNLFKRGTSFDDSFKAFVLKNSPTKNALKALKELCNLLHKSKKMVEKKSGDISKFRIFDKFKISERNKLRRNTVNFELISLK